MVEELHFRTEKDDLTELTGRINGLIEKYGMVEGDCIVYCPHTTAALLVTSRMDPEGWMDLREEVARLVPTRVDFRHQLDTPADAAGHIKSALLGVSSTHIVSNGRLLLGGSQGIYFMEFDGPRDRRVFVRLRGDLENTPTIGAEGDEERE